MYVFIKLHITTQSGPVILMYVCMHVYLYVGMYVFMYVRMYVYLLNCT